MTVFTASQLKQEISNVLNEVQTLGWVKISNRSRPDMVLITQEELDLLLSAQNDKGYEAGLRAAENQKKDSLK